MSIGLFYRPPQPEADGGAAGATGPGRRKTDGQGAFPGSRKFLKVCSGSPAPCSKSSEAVLR